MKHDLRWLRGKLSDLFALAKAREPRIEVLLDRLTVRAQHVVATVHERTAQPDELEALAAIVARAERAEALLKEANERTQACEEVIEQKEIEALRYRREIRELTVDCERYAARAAAIDGEPEPLGEQVGWLWPQGFIEAVLTADMLAQQDEKWQANYWCHRTKKCEAVYRRARVEESESEGEEVT